MNSRILRQIAGSPERMALAGDQLVVDLDLSEANLPAWTKLAIGDAVIEITDQPHNGCAKFSRRFGVEAHRFVNSPLGKELHLRARVPTSCKSTSKISIASNILACGLRISPYKL